MHGHHSPYRFRFPSINALAADISTRTQVTACAAISGTQVKSFRLVEVGCTVCDSAALFIVLAILPESVGRRLVMVTTKEGSARASTYGYCAHAYCVSV